MITRIFPLVPNRPAPELRPLFSTKFSDPSPLYQHSADRLIHRYPLVQYITIDGAPGISESAAILKQIYDNSHSAHQNSKFLIYYNLAINRTIWNSHPHECYALCSLCLSGKFFMKPQRHRGTEGFFRNNSLRLCASVAIVFIDAIRSRILSKIAINRSTRIIYSKCRIWADNLKYLHIPKLTKMITIVH